jgi:hypothetical protein
MMPHMARLSLLALLIGLLCPTPASAEVRGGAFEVGGLGGVAVWDADLVLEPCAFFGGYAGHRFDPLAERLYMGFRAGWEGCVTHQKFSGDRIDMIFVDVAFTYGAKLTDWLIAYGLSGAGFLVADSTPSGGKPFPRTVFQGGGGIAATLGRYLMIDLSVRMFVFENIQFGGFVGSAGTVASPIVALQVGGHI